MQLLKNTFKFYIESSLHVALAVYAFIRITYIQLDLPLDEMVANFGFFGSIVAYNFIKYDELARVKKIKLTRSFKGIIAFSFLAAVLSVYFFFKLNEHAKLSGLAMLFITIIYTLPFVPNQKNMRNWSGIKIYLVAIAWVGVTVFLPIINADLDCTGLLILKSIQRFILVFVLMLIFEIVDLQVDSAQLQTIPQQIGTKKTKYLGFVLLLFFCLLELFYINSQFSIFVIAILIAFLLNFASSKRNKYYTLFWVESVPIIWWLTLCFLS